MNEEENTQMPQPTMEQLIFALMWELQALRGAVHELTGVVHGLTGALKEEE